MTFEQLVVLDAIVNKGTFRGAAEHLNKAQSAVSHTLKKLEHEIGFSILSREHYRPELTKQGEVFYRHSIRVLRSMQDLKSVANNLNLKQEAEVMLTVSATFPMPALLTLLGQMTEEYPATHIRLSRDNLGGPIERLLTDEAQIIISISDGVPLEQVEALPLSPVSISPVAHPDFPAARDNQLKLQKEMQTYVQVVVADNSVIHRQSKGLVSGGLRWTVSDFSMKKEILLANMGWGGMPEHLIEKELSSGELVRLNVEGYGIVKEPHYLMRRKDISAGLVAQAMWERMEVL